MKGEKLFDWVNSWCEECGTGTACHSCSVKEKCDEAFEKLRGILLDPKFKDVS